ncbi:MAG: tyrosine-type recombinase/integrase [Methanococcoides sp.]|nr:tyrosine-type recombinase/integrase [Methanococcoides sp.]
MTRDVDDIHSFDTGYIQAMERLRKAEIGERNRELMEQFVISCRHEGLAKSTITGYINYGTRMIQQFQAINLHKDLDQITQIDFDKLLLYLEDEKELAKSTLRNYKKLVKKFFRWSNAGDPPKWVQNIKLKDVASPVQPHDILSREEFDRLLAACKHPRDKALIAVLADSGMRVGALASCRLKHVEFNKYGAILYISQTSRSKKTTAAKGIPLTWSTGYLNQWISVHPFQDDLEAPLWVTLDRNHEPLSYKTIRVTLLNIGKRAGIKKPVNPHIFRHLAITNWILDGLNEQEIKHRAGWSRGSTQMFKIYANFTDNEINERIFEKYGLKTDDKRHVTLKACPRCSNVLRPSDKFCSQCSLVLDRESLDKIQAYEEKIPELLQLVLKSDRGRDLIKHLA